jgi:hypothetical protein
MWNFLTFELNFRRLWFIIEMELHSIMALVTNKTYKKYKTLKIGLNLSPMTQNV